MMSRFRSTDCLEKQEDLTGNSLTNLVRKYFQDENLNVEILGEDKKFLDANDNFSSDTRKLYLRIINASRFNFLQRETSIIVKASLDRYRILKYIIKYRYIPKS